MSTRCLVASNIRPVPFSALDTMAVDTPARAATAPSVGRRQTRELVNSYLNSPVTACGQDTDHSAYRRRRTGRPPGEPGARRPRNAFSYVKFRIVPGSRLYQVGTLGAPRFRRVTGTSTSQ
ncbi:hypothetical protein GCM10027075_38210 [Streptomyces heilongjiangensis]